MDRNTHVGRNAERFRRLAFRPAFGNVVAEYGVAIQRALAQCFIPWDAQPLRNCHLLAVAGVEDMLQSGFDIYLGEVSRLHVSHNLQHLQQLANETFKGLFSGEGF